MYTKNSSKFGYTDELYLRKLSQEAHELFTRLEFMTSEYQMVGLLYHVHT